MIPAFNWQQKDWPAFTFARGALRDELAAFARYRLNHPAFEPDREPIEPINDGINEGINAAILRLVRNHPGRGVPFFLSSVKASRATVERAVRALVRAGRIEHRGSRKTGGYFPVDAP